MYPQDHEGDMPWLKSMYGYGSHWRSPNDYNRAGRRAQKPKPANPETTTTVLASDLKGGNRVRLGYALDASTHIVKAIRRAGPGELELRLQDVKTRRITTERIARFRYVTKVVN